MDIVLYSDDINLLTHWETSLDVPYEIAYSFEETSEYKNNIILLNVFESLHEIQQLINNENLIFILDPEPNIQKAKKFLQLGVKAYGNAMLRPQFLKYAIETIKEGMVWLHPELISNIITDLESTSTSSNPNENQALDILSHREKEIALLINDGVMYKDIAVKVDVSLRTVKAHAKHIYEKLNVKDRIGLALLLK